MPSQRVSIHRRGLIRWAAAGDGARLAMLVFHDDAEREYAYGPEDGLPDTRVGTFPRGLMDQANRSGWHVVSMKDDWNRTFKEE